MPILDNNHECRLNVVMIECGGLRIGISSCVYRTALLHRSRFGNRSATPGTFVRHPPGRTPAFRAPPFGSGYCKPSTPQSSVTPDAARTRTVKRCFRSTLQRRSKPIVGRSALDALQSLSGSTLPGEEPVCSATMNHCCRRAWAGELDVPREDEVPILLN